MAATSSLAGQPDLPSAGNSEAVMQLVGTQYCPPLDGAILFLEAYRLQKGHIQALLATVKLKESSTPSTAYCLDSDAPGTGNDRDIADIVLETTADYSFPVMQIGEIGHQVETLSLPIGATTEIDTSSPSLTLPKPVR